MSRGLGSLEIGDCETCEGVAKSRGQDLNDTTIGGWIGEQVWLCIPSWAVGSLGSAWKKEKTSWLNQQSPAGIPSLSCHFKLLWQLLRTVLKTMFFSSFDLTSRPFKIFVNSKFSNIRWVIGLSIWFWIRYSFHLMSSGVISQNIEQDDKALMPIITVIRIFRWWFWPQWCRWAWGCWGCW